MKRLNVIISGLAVLILLACSNEPPVQNLYLRSRIDQDLLDYIQKLDAQKYDITIRSGGGETQAGLKLGHYLQTKHLTLRVRSLCLSACAEFLLPAAKKVIFQDRPMVGFHWSPLMNYHQYLEKDINMEYCQFSHKEQESLLKNAGLNPDFWREVEKRLKLTKMSFVYKGKKCPWKIRTFENRFWLPDSNQLRNLWGLEFEGEVCADDPETCTAKIDKFWPAGTHIVIGNTGYVSKKPMADQKKRCRLQKETTKNLQERYKDQLSKPGLDKLLTIAKKREQDICAGKPFSEPVYDIITPKSTDELKP